MIFDEISDVASDYLSSSMIETLSSSVHGRYPYYIGRVNCIELQPIKLCPLGEPYGDSGNNFYLATNFVSR
jgi:hypothetical protein